MPRRGVVFLNPFRGISNPLKIELAAEILKSQPVAAEFSGFPYSAAIFLFQGIHDIFHYNSLFLRKIY